MNVKHAMTVNRVENNRKRRHKTESINMNKKQ